MADNCLPEHFNHALTIMDHEKRLRQLESVYTDIEDVKKIVNRIWRAIKWGAPSVITAAVTAGYINGDFAKIITAIFH